MTSWFKSRMRLVRERDEAVDLAKFAAETLQAERASRRDLELEAQNLRFHLNRAQAAETRANIEAMETARLLTLANAEIKRLRLREAIVRDERTGRFVRDVA